MEKLTAAQLYRFTTLDASAFTPSKAITKDSGILEFMQRFHPRAYQSLNFGLHLKRNHNHIFIMGEPGVGRIGMTKAMLKRTASQMPLPPDVVLVADFSETNKTQYLYFEAGVGHQFKKALETFVAQIKTQLPVLFDGHAYQLRSQQLENELLAKQEKILKPAYKLAETLNVEILQSENSFVLTAVIEGKSYRAVELKAFDEAIQKQYAEAFDQVEVALNKGLMHFPFLQHEYLDTGKQLNTEVANEYLTPLIKALKKKFGQTDKVNGYLETLQSTVVSKLHLFWDQTDDQVTANTHVSVGELYAEQQGLAVFGSNLLVDHRDLKHAPVIYEQNTTSPKLLGYTINSATVNAADTMTLAMNHQAGLLQQANGGYLMITIQSLLKDPEIWSHLKAALTSKKISFEIPSATNVVPYHMPDFPLNLTLVLVGHSSHFYALQEMDAQFDRLFKVQVEFEMELARTPEHEMTLAHQLAADVVEWEDLSVEVSAYERLVEYASRMVEDTGRLYTNKAILRDVLAESNAFARVNGQESVNRETVESTLLQHEFHTGLMEEYYHRAITEQQVLISTEGVHVGMVNGLTVLSVGQQSFGQPVRITAQASAGDEGVLDIEREVDMSGPIHSKGMLILSGYIRGRYMKHKALGFSGSIVMEQSYSGVEGDSASSAELLALLSSLADVPMRQDLAITGSINQFGEIQPIGGVNEKIEGYYKICHARGLTGQQGVIIPHSNTGHLMLNAEVRSAVESGQFHVYTIRHVEEALALFTGLSVESVNQKIIATLELMNEKPAEES